jgi:hypothetical protein
VASYFTDFFLEFLQQHYPDLGEKNMSNKFVSFLESVGKDFKKFLAFVLPYAAGPGEVAIAAFAPALGPMFNATVAAVVTAEQSAAAVGKQVGSGAQKLASVVQLMGPLIAQGLADAGKPNDNTAVQGYITSVVNVLNAAPAPTPVAS